MRVRCLVVLSLITLLPTLLIADVSYSVSYGNWKQDLEIEQDSIWFHLRYNKSDGYVGEPGEPHLPIEVIRLIIPRGEKIDSLTVDYVDTSHIGNYLVYPTQEPCGTCLDDPIPPFHEPDHQIYTNSSPYPNSIISVVSTGFFYGANKIVTLEISPLCFVGRDTLIYGNDFIVFTLHTSTSSDIGILGSIITTLGRIELERDLKALVVNDDALADGGPDSGLVRDYFA